VQTLTFAVAPALLLSWPGRWAAHAAPRTPGGDRHGGGWSATAAVLAEVTEHAGRVKLAGEVWTARASGRPSRSVGSQVTVVAIDGAIAVIRAEPRPIRSPRRAARPGRNCRTPSRSPRRSPNPGLGLSRGTDRMEKS
jgi:membrane-bound ClpP family serine protease